MLVTGRGVFESMFGSIDAILTPFRTRKKVNVHIRMENTYEMITIQFNSDYRSNLDFDM